jgi:polysaccharide pyruvyl transferase WcaK-like protein
MAVVCDSLPALRNVYLTSNGLLPDRLHMVAAARDEAAARNINFHYFISLDGVGEVHDAVRGVPGAFERVTRSLARARELGIAPAAFQCTVSSVNVWGLQDLLDYAEAEGVHVTFRLASPIGRLNNHDVMGDCALDQGETAEFCTFLYKLLRTGYEKDPARRAIYESLISALTFGSDRACGCWAREDGIYLSPDGDITSCAAHGQILGNLVRTPDLDWATLLEESRRQLAAESCPGCIHDYTGGVDPRPAQRDTIKEIKREVFRQPQSMQYMRERAARTPAAPARRLLEKARVMTIVGWYGTETAGDKLILAGIIEHALSINPDMRFSLSSITPFFTQHTLRELGYEDIVSVYPFSMDGFCEAAVEADVAAIGGGPLMELAEVADLLRFQFVMRTLGKPYVVMGCGIGPLYSDIITGFVGEIVTNASAVLLRDRKSVDWVREKGLDAEPVEWLDPSMRYIVPRAASFRTAPPRREGDPLQVTVCFRMLTSEYSGDLSREDHLALRGSMRAEHARFINALTGRGVVVHLVPMHTFFIGMDDRQYYASIMPDLDHPENVRFHNRIYAPQDVLRIMKNSDVVVGMRFHSVVFATSLGVPTLACDYGYGSGQQGKVGNYVSGMGLGDYLVDARTTTADEMLERFDAICADLPAAAARVEQAVGGKYARLAAADDALGTPKSAGREEG